MGKEWGRGGEMGGGSAYSLHTCTVIMLFLDGAVMVHVHLVNSSYPFGNPSELMYRGEDVALSTPPQVAATVHTGH